MAEEEITNLKEAIIDLYLAIKIRSTEEVFLFFYSHFEFIYNIVRQNR